MISAVLHYPSVFEPPAGIWWFDTVDNVPRSAYLPGNRALQTLGSSTMSGVQSQAQFDTWSQRMADRTADGPLWGVVEINPTMDPMKYLQLAAKQKDRVAA